MNKFKVGDKVRVTAGKDKGRDGRIEQIYPDRGMALIPEINMYKKHIKSTVAADGKGGIYDIAKPLPFAKLAVLCPNCHKATRLGFEMQSGKKVRICRKCGKAIDSKAKKDTKKKTSKK